MNGQEPIPELVPIADKPITVGSSIGSGLHLRHFAISRKHATITWVGDRLEVLDHDSRYGTFVNGTRVRKTLAKPGDLVQFGTAVCYRVSAHYLRFEREAKGLSLLGYDLSIVRGNKRILDGISFSVPAGSFVGIFGPSGVGKSQFLNRLAGYGDTLVDTGRLVFDGGHDAAIELEAYRAKLGYVPQEDILYTSLTARENLEFAARLRLAQSATEPAVASATNGALDQVGLLAHADKPAKLLSGGERKRLSVAVELLKQPRLLLLDEPTSGLDLGAESRLMEQLRQIARRGTTVICTTHVMENSRLFDNVIALGNTAVRGQAGERIGRLAYDGPPERLLQYFDCHNYPDLYDRLNLGRFPSTNDDAKRATPTPPPLQDHRGNSMADQASQQPMPDRSGDSMPKSLLGRFARQLMDPDWQLQSWLGFSRTLLMIWRDRPHLAAMIAQPLALGSVVCLTQFRSSALGPVVFFLVVIAIWLGMNNSIRSLVRDRRQFVRERLAGLKPAAYLTSQWASYSLVGSLQLLLLLMVVRLGGHGCFAPDTTKDLCGPLVWIRLFLVSGVSYSGGLGLGLLVSAIVQTEEAAIASLPLLIMPQLLISAVATGHSHEPWSVPRPFRPLVATVTDAGPYDRTAAVVVDVISMACLSRPAALAAEAPHVKGSSPLIWIGDMCHLIVLVFATWLIAIITFYRAERDWPRQLGLA